MDIAVLVLKWVLLIFLAGVIGQLGKSLTLKILAMRREKRGETPEQSPAAAMSAESEAVKKKRIKAELKQQKKRSKLLEEKQASAPDDD